MKAIGLIRVSTAVQDLNQQADIVKQEMIKDGYQNDAEHIILIKDKESAVKLSEEERHGLNQMKEAIIRDPEINCVYVFELSRISRRLDVLTSIRDFLIQHKVQLIVLKPYMRMLESDGSLSPAGTIMFSIFSGMSEIEGYLRKERTSRGKKKAQLEGKSLGNWLPIGYTTDEERHIIIDEEKAALVRKIFYMCVNENKSTTTIARELNASGEYPARKTIRIHASSIRNILGDTAYIGKGRFNKRRNKENFNRYPPIISDELFNEAQEILSKRKKLPKTNHKNIYYCKGIIRDTNSGMILRAAPSVASYCFASDRDDIQKFPSVTVPINLCDCFAWHLTQVYLSNTDSTKVKEAKKVLEKRQAELTKLIHVADKKVDELRSREDLIQRRIISGKLSEFRGDKMIEEIYEEFNALKLKNAEYSREWHLNQNKLHKYESGEIKKEALLGASEEDKFNLIHECIKEINIQKGGAPAEYRTKRNGLGVKYGIMTVTYENGIVEQYKFNSYTKKCFTMEDVEVKYEYELRIKGQQHQPGYDIKNKIYRDRKKQS